MTMTPRTKRNRIRNALRRIAIGTACASALLAPAPAQDGGRDLALIVACGDYPALRASLGEATYESRVRLRGPENDAALMRRTLVETLAFAPENVTTLAGWPESPESRPTLRNILAALSRLTEAARPGDRVVLYFAGHGVQQADADGDEADGLDEVFLPADASRFDSSGAAVPNGLSDDEIGRRVAAIRGKGAFVWLVMDTCHSGTMLRGGDGGVRFRRLDPELLGAPPEGSRTERRNRKKSSASELSSLDGVVAFYATQSFQLAPEMKLPAGDPDAGMHGLLTWQVASHLARSGGALSFRELAARVVHAYQALPYDGAMPLVEGDVSRKVAPNAPSLDASLFLTRRAGGEIALPAGTLVGIDRGTRLDVFRPAKSGGEKPALLARAEVAKAGLAESLCRIVEGEAAFAAESESVFPVAVASRPFGPSGLSIAVVSPDGLPARRESLPGAARAVLESPDFPHALVDGPERADVLLVADGDRTFLRPAKAAAARAPAALDPARLADDLARLARSRNMKRLAAGGLAPPLPEGLEVAVHRIGADGRPAPLDSSAVFRPGDLGRVALVNKTGRSFDLTALYLDAEGGIQAMFPSGRKTARVSHADTGEIELCKFRLNDEQQGIENLLVFAVPRAPNEPVSDFAWIADGAGPPARLRGSDARAAGGFSAFVRDLAFAPATRGVTLEDDAAEPTPSVALFTWRTEWGEVAPPETWLGAEPAPIEPAAAAAPPGPIPDPWALGPRVALAKASAASPKADLLLSGGERPDRVLVDADGDGEPVLGRAFDPEAAFLFLADRRIAYYDTDDDGRFDLALVDRDDDPEADERYVFDGGGGGAWREETQGDAPFLGTGYLLCLERAEAAAAVRRFSALSRD